jgi:hypothetical protein
MIIGSRLTPQSPNFALPANVEHVLPPRRSLKHIAPEMPQGNVTRHASKSL